MMSSLSEEARLSYFPSYMHSLLKAASLNDAVFEEANDWSCAAVWMKPGKVRQSRVKAKRYADPSNRTIYSE